MQYMLVEPTPGPLFRVGSPGKVSQWLRGRFFGGSSTGSSSSLSATGESKSAAANAAAALQCASAPAGANPRPEAPEVDPSLPCIFDEFELSEPLGKGASSVVYRARAKGDGSGRAYAVKVIALEGEKAADDAAAEFSLQQRLAHHGGPLATALGAYRGDPGKYYLLFDLMEGGSLKELPPVAEGDAQSIMACVFSALATLHKERIIHSDVKLENLMLHKPGDFDTVRLTDFGLCHDMKKLSWATEAAGTPPYFAPELARVFKREHGAVFGQHVDIWAAGVVLHELLSGEKPFDGQDFKTLLHQIAEAPVPMTGPAWEGVSEDAKDLVRRCLKRDFHTRISAKEALRHPWLRGQLAKRSSDGDAHHNGPLRVPGRLFRHSLDRLRLGTSPPGRLGTSLPTKW